MRQYSEEEVQDLTDKVFLLRDRIDAGKIHFAAHLVDEFRQSFEAIRLRPDGLVDPTTVDGRIRASTLAIRAFAYRDEAKQSVSLHKIQTLYFDFLSREFGFLYEPMSKAGASPAQAAAVAVRNDELVKGISEALPDMAEGITEFWSSVADPAAFHLQDGQQLKATFSGDLFPAHWENVVSTAGLYIDTVVLPCPILKIAPLLQALPLKKVVELLIKHVLTAMTYRNIALAEVDPPLVVISPNPKDVNDDDRAELAAQSQLLSCNHGGYLFGRDFDSVEHFADFCSHLESIENVLAELKGADRLIIDAEWGRSAMAQLEMAMKEGSTPGLNPELAGNHVLYACLGRMPQALASQQYATHFGGTPFIGAETSWQYFNWMLDYQGGAIKRPGDDRQSMHIVRALSAEAGNNLLWLGNIPPETVLDIRRAGLAEEVRSILGHGVSELVNLRPDNYFRTADQVVENLDRAFREHQVLLKEARAKKLKLYGIDVASCLAVGAIGVAGALTGNVALGAIGSVLGVAGIPNLKDIRTKYKDLQIEQKARANSPTGMLFRHLK
ncbi:hypothetical protein [Pseudomonas sp. B15(2017)]|uniref:hypothetical protein n=1 Tax=Pseudomonas sp. B15(2017) TaxID=1981744 RepID=UPI000A1DB623|nr:hypothetical protein [Pseudomonas sp. B15(2017)]